MICEFTVSPIGPSVSLSAQVAKIIDRIDSSGLPYQTHAMGTIVEGSWDDIMMLIRQCHDLMLEDNERVSTTIRIDDRKGSSGRLQGKVDSVEHRLGRKIRR